MGVNTPVITSKNNTRLPVAIRKAIFDYRKSAWYSKEDAKFGLDATAFLDILFPGSGYRGVAGRSTNNAFPTTAICQAPTRSIFAA